MTIKTAIPYLFFDGNAAAAINLYEQALGAKTVGLMRYEQGPDGGPSPKDKDRVMHAFLRLGEANIMISDVPSTQKASKVGNVEVCLEFDDPKEMERKFNALAKGGRVKMPLEDAFWGARFGALVDAYNINWMFNHTLPRPE